MTTRRWDAVVFDYGRVLTHSPSPDDLAQFTDLSGIDDPAAFWQLYGESRDAYDCGHCDYREHWARFCDAAGVWITEEQVEKLAKLELDVWTRENHEMLALARNIKEAGLKTAILSNMPHDLLAEMRASFDWLADFDVQIWSCELGVVKPNPEIYRVCLKALGCEPSRALFFDDRPRNVEGAVRVGIEAHVFISPQQARAIVERGLMLATPTKG